MIIIKTILIKFIIIILIKNKDNNNNKNKNIGSPWPRFSNEIINNIKSKSKHSEMLRN